MKRMGSMKKTGAKFPSSIILPIPGIFSMKSDSPGTRTGKRFWSRCG